MTIPDDFPQFRVPAHEKEMALLRDLYWHHYGQCRPAATMWDEWMPMPSLWPAVTTDNAHDERSAAWDRVLSTRIIDDEGYVSIHQHASIAHPLGWPFPFWNQGQGGCGWHFSFKDTVGPGWRQDHLSTTTGWHLANAADAGLAEYGWVIDATGSGVVITAPEQPFDSFQAPFMQIRWRSTGLENARPCLEWTVPGHADFSPERRMFFPVADGEKVAHTVVPVHRHPQWRGQITRLRICLNNTVAPATVTLQGLFTTYDTRHNINSQSYVTGCANYFWWTGNHGFLRRNIGRMRTALHYVMTEHHTLRDKVVVTDWWGHDGRSGLAYNEKGEKQIRSGIGIGNNYWDLMPFGGKDSYATLRYYGSLLVMAAIEREIREHPEWNIPLDPHALDSDELLRHAAEIKEAGNRLFWNDVTGRFTCGLDADGKQHDYGMTFLNLEAVFYDFATSEHAREIMRWIVGERIVADDTSTGTDIYHWRFAPRSTTKRNVDYYFWAWSSPESIPWGGQVQDGGAVLGFSYHDLMARLAVLGPDDCWKRLSEILAWYGEVKTEGGYRAYYDGRKREGTMQGSGTAGGLGLDMEFIESALVPQIMLAGFMGFAPTGDGFRVNPRLPASWPELEIRPIRYHGTTLTIRATSTTIEISRTGEFEAPVHIGLPPGKWSARTVASDGSARDIALGAPRPRDNTYRIDWPADRRLVLKRP